MLPPSMRPYIRETTDRNIMSRERSIHEYIEKNSVDNFVVLDDEAIAFTTGMPLIPCDGNLGLSQPSVVAELRLQLDKWAVLEYGNDPTI